MQVGGLILRDLSEAIVRSNPQYQFRPLESLAPAELNQLGHDPTTTSYNGVMVDIGCGKLSVKAVSSDTDRLFKQVQVPTPVCKVLPELPPQERDRALARLIFEGILQIAFRNTWVNECAAYGVIVQNDDSLIGMGTLPSLAVDALKHGQRLAIEEPEQLAAKLYFYNRIPVTCSWRQLWQNADAVHRYLRVAIAGAPSRDLSSCFEMSALCIGAPWLSWRRRGSHHVHQRKADRYKLYVSPRPDHIREAFAQVTMLLPTSAALSMKIGAHAHGLLRPDKLVVYFDQQHELLAFSEMLRQRLSGLSPHGVPFSAPIDDAGILSWGIDPSRATATIGRYADDSWRIWICNRLAVALIASMHSSEPEAIPWRYALTTISLAGVDTRTWTRHQYARSW